MAAPHNAAIQRQARIAQAQADQAAVEAQQKSAQAQAQYQQQTSEVQAAAQARINVAQANAEAETVAAQQESERRQAEAKKAAMEAQTVLAEQQAELAAKQLETSQVKPAEAAAKIVKLKAEADAEATTIKAAAAAANDRVALDQMWIQIMPEIVEKLAASLSNSNLTVLNGADGLGEVMSGLVTQAVTIFNAAKAQTHNGHATHPQVQTPVSALPAQPVDGQPADSPVPGS
jgi:hypothetical protein